MASVISGDANVSATEFGYLDGVTSALQTQMDAKAPLASPTFTGTPELPDGTTLAGSLLTSGKILQIVRATDTTSRSTTSTSLVDVTGMSVTITPQKSDSAIIVVAMFVCDAFLSSGSEPNGQFTITDSSNNAVSGAQAALFGNRFVSSSEARATLNIWGYSTPATTSATTYKLRFLSQSANTTVRARNNVSTGQMYAIEVSA